MRLNYHKGIMETPGNVVIVLYKKGSKYKILLSRTFVFYSFELYFSSDTSCMWMHWHPPDSRGKTMSTSCESVLCFLCVISSPWRQESKHKQLQQQEDAFTHTGLNNKTLMRRFWMRLRNVLQWFSWLSCDLAGQLWIKWHFKCTFFFLNVSRPLPIRFCESCKMLTMSVLFKHYRHQIMSAFLSP